MTDTKHYRRFPFQVKYKKDLHIIEDSAATPECMINHFAKYGYENLYITENGKLASVITINDYLHNSKIYSLHRDFILDRKVLSNREDIMRYFIDHPHIDRITIVDNEKLVCEIDGLIELPLQNGKAKNIIALRYVDCFQGELTSFFEGKRKVLLIANNDITNYLSEKFPLACFESIEDIKDLSGALSDTEYDCIIDFVYSSNIRKAIGIHLPNLVSFSALIAKYAIAKVRDACSNRGIHTLFYRLQNYNDLTCLSDEEYENCISEKKAGELLQNQTYLHKFARNKNELDYLNDRDYHASLRLDNGYCFVQDECNEPLLHVHKGIRNPTAENSHSYTDPTIFFFGPCTTYGFLLPDNETIPALVKNKVISCGISVDVENHAGIHGYNELNSLMTALAAPARAGDIFVFYDSFDDLDPSEYPDLKQTFEWFNSEKSRDEIWFLDFPGHCNLSANELISTHISKDVINCLNKQQTGISNCQRRTKIIESFDRFENLKMTHSSCIQFFQKYKEHLFAVDSDDRIGAVMIPDSFSTDESVEIIKRITGLCDKLYVFKTNICLTNIDISEKLFDATEIIVSGTPVRIMQLGYFFDSSRYLTDYANQDDCDEEFIFTETALAKSIFQELSISIRFFPETNIRHKILKDIYDRLNIAVVNV